MATDAMTSDTMSSGTAAGATEFAHMLLKVSDIARSERFYVDLLGFKVRPAKPLADRPKPQRCVLTDARQRLAVRREGHRQHPVAVARQCPASGS